MDPQAALGRQQGIRTIHPFLLALDDAITWEMIIHSGNGLEVARKLPSRFLDQACLNSSPFLIIDAGHQRPTYENWE